MYLSPHTDIDTLPGRPLCANTGRIVLILGCSVAKYLSILRLARLARSGSLQHDLSYDSSSHWPVEESREGNVDLDKDGFGISNSDPLTAPMVV
jgi:hypothetical protein